MIQCRVWVGMRSIGCSVSHFLAFAHTFTVPSALYKSAIGYQRIACMVTGSPALAVSISLPEVGWCSIQVITFECTFSAGRIGFDYSVVEVSFKSRGYIGNCTGYTRWLDPKPIVYPDRHLPKQLLPHVRTRLASDTIRS